MLMILTGKRLDNTEYVNTTKLNFNLNHRNKRIDITVTDTKRPQWQAEITATNKDGEVTVKTVMWI